MEQCLVWAIMGNFHANALPEIASCGYIEGITTTQKPGNICMITKLVYMNVALGCNCQWFVLYLYFSRLSSGHLMYAHADWVAFVNRQTV